MTKRGRPLGAKNKPKTSNMIECLRFDKQIAGSPVNKTSIQGWVNWGMKNNYPNLLLDLYNQSPTHRACIIFGVQSIVGNGVDYTAMKLDKNEVNPNPYQTWDDIIKNLALDFMLYGSYAIEIIKNKDNTTYSYYHIPLEKVRWSEYNDEGAIDYYWICSDWTAPSRYKPIKIKAFDNNKEIKRGETYLYVYRQYSPALTYYTQPHYQAAIKSIQAEVEYVNFDLRQTVNNFTPSGMLVLDEVETDEEKQKIINNITDMFTGSENANTILISFRSNIEQQQPQFIPFQANSENYNIFADANERTISRILAGHQIPNASLVGMPDLGSTGFASEADKLEVAYQLYNKLTGNANRMAVIKTLNLMFAMNGIETEIIMKPLSFNDFGNDADVAERTTIDDENNDLNEEE